MSDPAQSSAPAVEPPTASTSAVPDEAPTGDGRSYPPSAVALFLAENPTLSRSAAKKILREKAWEEGKAERKAVQKAKDKAKAQRKRELAQAGDRSRSSEPAPKKARGAGRKKPFQARVVVDLGFDELMTDKEVKSMASQMSYCYSANRKTGEPLPILFTSFNGRLKERYESVGDQQHKLWKGVEWWEEDYTRLWRGKQGENDAKVDEAAAEANAAAGALASEAPAAGSKVADPLTYGLLKGKQRSSAPQSKVVYLTGDSPNVLTELEEGTTYILGGIVDRNRYKNLCYDKAVSHEIAHAQLPIGEFLPEMTTRKVLTVNQVFEIMVGWVRHRAEGGPEAWKRALREVMPLRKFDENHRANKKVNAKGEEVEEEAEEEGDEAVEVDGETMEPVQVVEAAKDSVIVAAEASTV